VSDTENGDNVESYKNIQRGGEIPFKGLQKPAPDKSSKYNAGFTLVLFLHVSTSPAFLPLSGFFYTSLLLHFSFLVFPWQPSMLFYTKTFMKYNEIIMFYCCAVMYYSNVITTFNQISICLKSHFCDYIFSYILDAFWCLYVPLNGSKYMTLMYNFNTFVVQIKAVINQTFLISLFFLHIVLLPWQRVLSQ